MKKLLLSTVALAATFAVASAATPLGEAKTTTLPVNTRVVKNGVNADKKVKQLAPGVTVTTDHGFKKLNNMYGAADASVIKPSRAAIARATPPEGYVLFESFEGCDLEDENWVPEGWTVEMNGNVKRAESWGGVMGDGFYLPKGPDGDYYFSIFAGSKDQDEWLISPYVEVADKMDLTYWLYMQPMWLFVIDSNHIDWTTREFIGEPEVAATLQIWAQAEGEDWVMLRDYADEYKDMSFKDLEKINPRGLEENQVGLENYYGKKTRVAFRYVGFDGGIMFVDAIGIGYPAIENVSFLNPFDMQYWGLLRSPFLQALDVPVGVYPVNVPITWMNSDVAPDLTYPRT
ncbi:MAG: choice-of-anchor J domain-containing protein [Muribaculaceae bacterium]|nr:choice-of-anchor J domain-containing protein [Muribaculaceae bacterium]